MGRQNAAAVARVEFATPLKKMMGNEEFTKLTRAFAVVALGMVADKGRLPWNSKIGANINYRAVVETLTESGTGILDIL